MHAQRVSRRVEKKTKNINLQGLKRKEKSVLSPFSLRYLSKKPYKLVKLPYCARTYSCGIIFMEMLQAVYAGKISLHMAIKRK